MTFNFSRIFISWAPLVGFGHRSCFPATLRSLSIDRILYGYFLPWHRHFVRLYENTLYQAATKGQPRVRRRHVTIAWKPLLNLLYIGLDPGNKM